MVEKPDGTQRTPADERKERLKAALRENLRRRKAPEAARPQAGQREAGQPQDGQGGSTKRASKPKA